MRCTSIFVLFAAWGLAFGWGTVRAQAPGEGLWPVWDSAALAARMGGGTDLRAQDLYSPAGTPSMAQGIVLLNGQCTGSFVSPQGLLLTNHHCILDALEGANGRGENLLRDGFWAKDLAGERPLQGLRVEVMRGTADVSAEVLGYAGSDDPAVHVERAWMDKTGFTARVHAFDEGSAYRVFLYETFTDVRLVGVPNAALARAGGEEAYGGWPLYAADFAFLRVYADSANRPAAHSKGNQPLEPRHVFKVSRNGIGLDEFVMMGGYPGMTSLYLPSRALVAQLHTEIPVRMELAAATQEVLAAQIDRSRIVERDYGAVYRALSTSGRSLAHLVAGARNSRLLEIRNGEESDMMNRLMGEERSRLRACLAELETVQAAHSKIQVHSLAVRLAISWTGVFRFALGWQDLADITPDAVNGRYWSHTLKMKRSQLRQHFHHYHAATDAKLCASILTRMVERLGVEALPPLLAQVHKRWKGDFAAYAAWLFKRSALVGEDRATELLGLVADGKPRRLQHDPAYRMAKGLAEWHDAVLGVELEGLEKQLTALRREYLALWKAAHAGYLHFPDANGTLRFSFGTAMGPAGKEGEWQTDLGGFLAWADSAGHQLPERFTAACAPRTLSYADGAGRVPVCFLAALHTSNGNSGSPALDREGRLVGIDMARSSAGLVSDYRYDPAVVRAVGLDIRYILFLADLYAPGKRVTGEMGIE